MVPAERPELPALVLAMSERIAEARRRSLAAVSREMVLLYWEFGRHIVEFEQGGERRAEYGEALWGWKENLVLAGRFALQLPDPAQLSAAVAEALRNADGPAPDGVRRG